MSDEKHIPLVIYHANCWDGFCAAWIARKALGEIEAYPGYYGQSPPDVTGRSTTSSLSALRPGSSTSRSPSPR